LVARGEEVDGAVAFGEGKGLKSGGDGDALGDGGEFCLGGRRLPGLLAKGGATAEEAKKALDFSMDYHLVMITRERRLMSLVLFYCK
jgi:hypothetical protein